MMAAAAAAATDPADRRWLAFVESHPDATVFHHPRWLELLAGVYGYRPLVLTLRDSHDAIVAGAPFLEVDSWLTGRRLVSLPFTDHCPPLARDAASLEEFVTAVAQWRRGTRAPRLEFHAGLPREEGVHRVQVGVRHVLALEPDAHRVRSRFRRTVVQKIGQAKRDGVTVVDLRTRQGLEPFYRLQCRTRKRLGVPVQPRRFFEAVWRVLIERDMGFALLAYREGRPIAAMVFFAWNRRLIYKYSASDPEYVRFRPNNLLLSAAIEWACGNGFETMDFGRTSIEQEGLRSFKSGWGAAEFPLEYSYFGGEARAPSAGYLNRVSSRIIRLSPPIVCRAIGETLYAHFA